MQDEERRIEVNPITVAAMLLIVWVMALLFWWGFTIAGVTLLLALVLLFAASTEAS